MNCEEAQRIWHERLDMDDQNVADWPAVDDHMRSCAACVEFVEQMSLILGGFETLRDRSQQATEGTQARAIKSGPRSIRREWPLQWARVAAAVAIFAGGFWVLYGSRWQRTHMAETPAASRQVRSLGITLREESAQKFLAVARPTGSSDVQFFRLYERAGGSADNDS